MLQLRERGDIVGCITVSMKEPKALLLPNAMVVAAMKDNDNGVLLSCFVDVLNYVFGNNYYHDNFQGLAVVVVVVDDRVGCCSDSNKKCNRNLDIEKDTIGLPEIRNRGIVVM